MTHFYVLINFFFLAISLFGSNTRYKLYKILEGRKFTRNKYRSTTEYRVAWLRNGTIRLTNCLRTQPRWMAERRDVLGSLPMSKVFLPGTHDSASYAIHERADFENIVEKYVITQVQAFGSLTSRDSLAKSQADAHRVCRKNKTKKCCSTFDRYNVGKSCTAGHVGSVGPHKII